MTTNQTAALLRRAADVIETDGWTQGQLGNCRDGYCAIGAIQHAAVTSINLGDATDDAIQALGGTTNSSDALTRTAAWNDDPNRTSAEVLDTLRRTADQLTARA